jgi:hypothetical protein
MAQSRLSSRCARHLIMSTEHKGVHDYLDDPRNADILVSVNGALKRREEAEPETRRREGAFVSLTSLFVRSLYGRYARWPRKHTHDVAHGNKV